MLAAVANSLRVPELRNRLLFTAAMLLLYRSGVVKVTDGFRAGIFAATAVICGLLIPGGKHDREQTGAPVGI